MMVRACLAGQESDDTPLDCTRGRSLPRSAVMYVDALCIKTNSKAWAILCILKTASSME